MLRDSVQSNCSHHVVTLDRLLGRKRKIGSSQSVVITVDEIVPVISLGVNRPESAVNLLGLSLTCNLSLVTDSARTALCNVTKVKSFNTHSLI